MALWSGSSAWCVSAQGGQGSAPATPAASRQGGHVAAPSSGFRAEYLNNIADVEKKLVSLAEAVPPAKYTWRPAEGVRSISEVFLHIAGGNYTFSRLAGVDPPAEFQGRGFDKSTTDKAQVIEALKKSFENARQAAMKTSDADLDTKVKFGRGEMTKRNLLLSLVAHMHEHLGQSIAYARMNGVVPPWSASQ